MIDVSTNIDETHERFGNICSCFRNCALAIAFRNQNLVTSHKYGILYWILDEDIATKVSNRQGFFDDPEFDYWILRIGYAAQINRDKALIVENLKLFCSWLFVKVNR